MYTTLAGKITVIDPKDLDSATLTSTGLMTLGDDGNIYYANGTLLKKIVVTKGTGELPIQVKLPITNGSFNEVNEDGTIPGWSSMFKVTPNVSYGISNEQFLTAPSSLKLTDTATNETVAVASDHVPVTAGTEYTANVNHYLESGRTLASFNFYDANNKQVGNTSLQITSGHGKWQTLEMKKTAPEGAVYAKVVLFCSNFWMTASYYDDVSVSYTMKVSPNGLQTKIGELEQAGELSHSLSMMLQEAVKQAIHHRDGERPEQAVKHLQDALKHLENAKPTDASGTAHSLLKQVIEAFVQDWS